MLSTVESVYTVQSVDLGCNFLTNFCTNGLCSSCGQTVETRITLKCWKSWQRTTKLSKFYLYVFTVSSIIVYKLCGTTSWSRCLPNSHTSSIMLSAAEVTGKCHIPATQSLLNKRPSTTRQWSYTKQNNLTFVKKSTTIWCNNNAKSTQSLNTQVCNNHRLLTLGTIKQEIQ